MQTQTREMLNADIDDFLFPLSRESLMNWYLEFGVYFNFSEVRLGIGHRHRAQTLKLAKEKVYIILP